MCELPPGVSARLTVPRIDTEIPSIVPSPEIPTAKCCSGSGSGPGPGTGPGICTGPGLGPGTGPGPGPKCSTTLPDSCGARVVNKPKTPSGSIEESCFYSNGIIKPECANKCTVSSYKDPQTFNPSKCFRKPSVPQ